MRRMNSLIIQINILSPLLYGTCFAVWFGSSYSHIYFNLRMGIQNKGIICSPAVEALIDITSFVSLKSYLSCHLMTQQRLPDLNVPMEVEVVFFFHNQLLSNMKN